MQQAPGLSLTPHQASSSDGSSPLTRSPELTEMSRFFITLPSSKTFWFWAEGEGGRKCSIFSFPPSPSLYLS